MWTNRKRDGGEERKEGSKEGRERERERERTHPQATLVVTC